MAKHTRRANPVKRRKSTTRAKAATGAKPATRAKTTGRAKATTRKKPTTRAKTTTRAMPAERGKPAERALVVTLSGDRKARDVARDLKAAGLAVDQVLEAVGVVTGSAPADGVQKLRGVRGVADVSPDHPVDIGPPGSPIS